MRLKKTSSYPLFCLVLFFLISANGKVHSQPITIPYSCGFEDPVENQEWILNYGPEGTGCKDKWTIGNGARNEGLSGLYISTDSMTAKYGWGYANTVVAYREFTVPEHTRYDISFDWMNNGKPGTSELYVLLLMESDNKLPSDSTNAYTLTGTTSDIVSLRRLNSTFNNSSQWNNYDHQETFRTNQKYTLMFVWSNSCPDSVFNPIGACIDNIQIASTWCPKPYDLNIDANCDTTVLSWKGTSSYYETEYKLKGSNYPWRKLGVQTTTQVRIANLPEGIYDFRVRGICQNDTSAYKTINSIIIFCPEDHCINFVDFNAPGVTAYNGVFGNPCRTLGVIDYGSENEYSQHTVNWIQDEFDDRTEGKLRTIPEGSYASVRLGNWDKGAKGECLEYEYTVDSLASILLLKYAVLLEEPSHADPPAFRLQILDEKGNLIDPTCGQANFEADGSLDWNISRYKNNYVNWKDWTTVGLNLSDYVGRKLTIKLSTEDCKQTGHFGYAYFTLDCTSATLNTNTCGDALEMTISAPDGFSYRWYNPEYPMMEWNTREIEIPVSDSTTYFCEVCFLEDPSCCFELSTKVYPRFPVADFSYKYVTENCQNIIRLKNNSHVVTRYNEIEEHTNEHCDTYLWEFSNGLSSSITEPEIICDNEGDTLFIMLTAYLSDCLEQDSLLIIVPAIGETVDTMYHEMCYGESYYFGRNMIMLFQQGIFYDTVPSRITGCDSITILELTVHPQYDDPVVFDTICFGEVREFAGRHFSETKRHDVWEKSIYGCDSVLTLDLYVRDEITFDLEVTDVLQGPYSGKIEIKDVSITDYSYTVNGEWNGDLTGLSGGIYTIILYNEFGCASEQIQVIVFQDCLEMVLSEVPVICGDDDFFEINYSINKGFATTYDVLFSDEAKAAGFSDLISVPADGQPVHIVVPRKIRPDNYWMNIRFEDLLCDSVVNILPFTVYYPQSILEQKWNDVIAILNYDNNDGYEFAAYQWYKNGSPLFGENHSYLYIENDELDFDAEYSVLLTRSDDGKSILTCPIFPAYRNSEISLYPLIVYKQERVNLSVSADASVTIYDSLGRKQRAFSVASGNSIQLNVSDQTGYYIVIVQLDNGMQESFKVLVR